MVELILLYVTSVLIIFGYSTGCNLSSNKTYINAHHQVVLFDSMMIANNSLEIEFDIKLDKYCRSCTIMQIDDIISLSIDSRYNIFEISINNEETDNTHIPNADILLPTGNQFHHIYLSNSLLTNSSIYNQNVFKIDNFTRTYGGSIDLEQTGPYKVYIGSGVTHEPTDILNASIKNICINSPIKKAENIFSGELRCGDSIYGEHTWSEEVNYYYFQLTHTSDVIFDTCDSSYGTYFDLHTIGYLKNDQIAYTWEDNCFPGAQYLIISLPKGRYIVEIGQNGDIEDKGDGYSEWMLQVTCSRNDLDTNQIESKYYVLPELILQNSEWYEDQRKCENMYGTTLATIITDEDLKHALHVVKNSMDITQNIYVWIGLSQTASNKFRWQWIDGTKCDYTNSGDCRDDLHWDPTQPDGKPISDISRNGAALFITKDTNNTNLPSFYDFPLDAKPIHPLFFLCNAPDSKYSVKNCSFVDNDCWEYDSWERQFYDNKIESDITGIFDPFIGHYNKTLFLIGNSEIHSTPMKPFDENYVWSHRNYHNNTKWNSAGLYSQYKSSIYMYGTKFNSLSLHNEVYLLHIDLNTLQSRQYNVGLLESIPLYTKCIVATDLVYIIQQTVIFQFNIINAELHAKSHFGSTSSPVFTQQKQTTSCVVTNDEEFIYMFAMAYGNTSYNLRYNAMFTIVKYEIATGKNIYVHTSDTCLTRNGFVTAITAGNGNIYLHGCNYASWKTMIFNTVTDKFENTTVDIQIPLEDEMPYYQSSKIVAEDNNILFLYVKNKNGISSYVTVTDLVSIDFKATENTEKIWVSDGFYIRYYINDFNSNLTAYYRILFYSNDTKNTISEWLNFSTFEDHCICHNSVYQCYGCWQYFNLDTHLTLEDNIMDEITFTLIHNDLHALITPITLKIPLQRCVISIEQPREIQSAGHSIVSTFNLSSNCYTRYWKVFSLNITAQSIRKQLMITVLPNNNITCNVCDLKSKNCDVHMCDGNQFTIINNLDDIPDTDFKFKFLSNSKDLIVLLKNNKDILHWRDFNWNYFYYGFCVLIIPIIIAYYCYRQYMRSLVVNKALVLIIPIDRFDDHPEMFLPGVRGAMINLENLWKDKYNYDVHICNKVQKRCSKADVFDFIDENLKNINRKKYGAIIVHVISHGKKDAFKCSDMKDIEIEFLKHELIEAAEDKNINYDIIKLIFNHVCQGENNYSSGNILANIDEEYVFQQRGIFSNDIGGNESIESDNSDDVSADSNLQVISGTVPGRTMSDSGLFTECICKSFGTNVTRFKKRDFNTLIVEIGINVEQLTGKAELVNTSGNLRYTRIRFEKTKKELHLNKTTRGKSDPLKEQLLSSVKIVEHVKTILKAIQPIVKWEDDTDNKLECKEIDSDLYEKYRNQSVDEVSEVTYANQNTKDNNIDQTEENNMDTDSAQTDTNTIRNSLISTEKLLNLANQLKSNEEFQKELSINSNLIVEYTIGDEAKDSSSTKSNHSGESKHNSDDENGDNSNDDSSHHGNNNNNDDDHDEKDNSNKNQDHKCTMHKYDCNVSWHAVKLKELEEENRRLKLFILQKQTTINDETISQLYDNAVNMQESENINSNSVNTTTNFKVTRKLAKKIIPNNTDELFCNVYDYMNKYFRMHNDLIEDYKSAEKDVKVIDCGIQGKVTKETLYIVCEKENKSNHSSILWKTNDDLYSASRLEQIYKISKDNLSPSVTISDKTIAAINNAKQHLTHILKNEKQRNVMIGSKNTPWNNEEKIPVFNKATKQTGLTLMLEKHEFVQKLKTFANNINDIKLIPIVRFNNENKYFYEVAWIVEIGKDINVAISFKHIKNKYLPSAIFLDIHDAHKLAAYKHNCDCLTNFNCFIDRLQIGENKQMRMYQRYKRKMEQKVNEQKNQIDQHENQMQDYLRLRAQDILIIDDMKLTCENLQRDLQSLLQLQCIVNQQQQTCNRLHELNTLHTLNLNSQVYSNQLTTQFNNLNLNQQQ